MPKTHVRKGDTVLVLTGKNKGAKGVVESVDAEGQKVIVEGVNLVKRHNKAKPPLQPSGSITEKAAPIHISNVMLMDSSTKQPTRVRYEGEGRDKKRVSVKTGKPV